MHKKKWISTCQGRSLTLKLIDMLNRDYKNFAFNTIHHAFNRGNNKEKIFYDRQDYKAFIFRMSLVLGFEPKELLKNDLTSFPNSRIRINSKPNLFKIHSFCLMPNHFHLLIEQSTDIPISRFILQLCTSFSMYFNKKYKRVGHVFQDRFKSVLVDSDPQLMWNCTYIHMNPVTSNLVNNPEEYEWSSYKDFSEDRNLPITSRDLIPELFENKEKFIKETLAFVKKNDMSRAPLGF